MAENSPITRKQLFNYGVLALPLAFASMPLYIYAPDFYATEFGVSLSTIGFILLGLRFFDAIQDPMIGTLSDRFAAKRLRVMVIASIALLVGFAALFQPWVKESVLLWFSASMLLATTAFSVITINLNTLGGLWSTDTHQKTRITGAREAFGMIGLLLAVLLPAVLQHKMPAFQAFTWVTLTLSIIIVVCVVIFARWYRHNAPQEDHQGKQRLSPSMRRQKKALFAGMNKQRKAFFVTYAVSMLASSIPAILVLFFIRDRLEAEAYTGLFLLLYFLSGAVGMVLWQKLSRSYDKPRAWMIATLLAVVSFIWAYFLEAGDLWQYGIICVVSGVAFGGDLALPPSILADHIQHSRTESHASLQFGLLAFLGKAALAIASAIVLPVLENSGFEPATVNSQNALEMLSITYAAIPCAIKLFAIILLWRTLHLNSHGDTHAIPPHHTTIRSHSDV